MVAHAKPLDLAGAQAQLTVALGETLGKIGEALDDDLAAAQVKIAESGNNARVMRREIRWVMAAHYVRIDKALVKHTKLARTLAGQHQSRYVAAALKSPPRPLSKPIVFNGDDILKANVKPWRQAKLLSRDLHLRAKKAADEIVAQGMASVRDHKHLTRAATDLIHVVENRRAGALGQGNKIPKLMRRIEKAGRALNSRGSPADLKAWQQVRKKLRRYLPKLDATGRTYSSYLELLQRTSEDSAKGIGRALKQHGAFRQKYVAERIIKTQQNADWKDEQLTRDARHKWIVGYTWRMHRSGRAKKTKGRGRSRKGKGKRKAQCICPSMDGRRVSKEQARERPMAHPHCACSFEPIFDRRLMDRG